MCCTYNNLFELLGIFLERLEITSFITFLSMACNKDPSTGMILASSSSLDSVSDIGLIEASVSESVSDIGIEASVSEPTRDIAGISELALLLVVSGLGVRILVSGLIVVSGLR